MPAGSFLPLLMFEGKLAQQLPADLRGKQNKRLSRHRAPIALNRRMHFLQTVALDCVEDQHIAKTRSIRRSFHRHHYIIGGTSLKVVCCNSTPQARVVIGKVFADFTTSWQNTFESCFVTVQCTPWTNSDRCPVQNTSRCTLTLRL